MVKKQFPIGIQNLAELRQGNYYYVDKTAKIIELINTSKSQHTTKKRKSLLKQWHNNNFSHEPPLCQTLTDSVKY